jgi:hypothetical protein
VRETQRALEMLRAAGIGIAVIVGGLCWAGCGNGAGNARCDVNGPAQLMPASVKRVRLGMSKAEVERILGKADYSPIEGQYYFSTGGECPLEDANRKAPCGVIADFRRCSDPVLTGSLQSCTWGGIGE